MTLNISPIKALKDNYIWAIHDKEHCYVVDPGQSEPVMDFLKQHNYKLSGILITHHHPDHLGGMVNLQNHYQVPAWGPDDTRINGQLEPVHERDVIELTTLGVKLNVLFIPGHTLSHIAFYNNEWLFSGDALFSIGCGRMFEGNPSMFVESLNKIKALPDSLNVYCGHEYTLNNCQFALTIEPDSQPLLDYIEQVKNRRHQNKASLPVSLKTEKQLNPFLRTDEEKLQHKVNQLSSLTVKDTVSCFAALREMKDNF